MGHDGLRGFSINGFVGTTPVPADVVSQFIREFDTGVAPMVGRTITVFATDVTPQGGFVSGATWKADLVREMEHQAELANAGLAVHVFDDDGTGDGNPDDVELSRSFWYKVTELDALLQNPVPYKEENASTILSREGLLLLLGSADCATFTSTPLGSERRVASLSGDASVPSGSGTSIAQIGTTPNTANADAIGMTLQATLAWTETDPFNPPFRIRSQEIFRNALGLPAQHDFARRLRFTGVGLQEGGRVKIGIDMDSSDAPDASGDTDFQYITLPIHPTNAFQGANRIWETSVELEPLFLYMLLLGGPEGTGIDEIMTAPPATQPPPETFNPAQWNRYRLSYISPSNVSTTETVVALVY